MVPSLLWSYAYLIALQVENKDCRIMKLLRERGIEVT
jgi:hypothetical protein